MKTGNCANERTAFSDASERLGPQLPTVLCVVAIAAVVGLFAKGWLAPGLPPDDFPGNVAHVWEIRNNLISEGRLSLWCPTWFDGQPRTLLFARALSVAVPLALSFLGPIASLKAALVLFQFLSGLAMYWFLGGISRDRGVRAVGAVMYAVHPMVVLETARMGHMEVAMFFPFPPLVFGWAQRAFDRADARSSVVLGILLALGLWTDNEGAFVTYPFLLAVLAFSALRSRAERGATGGGPPWRWSGALPRRLYCLVLAMAACLGLTAFFCLPVLCERGYHQFFDPAHVEEAIRTYGYRNPLLAVNRRNFFAPVFNDLKDNMWGWTDRLYLGVSTVVFDFLAIVLKRRPKDTLHLQWFSFAWIAFVLSFGPYSVWDSFGVFWQGPRTRLTLLGLAGLACLLAMLITVSQGQRAVERWKARRTEAAFLAVLVVLGCAIPWFMVLRTLVPFLRGMRCPLWFFITPCVFGAVVLASLGMESVRRRLPRKRGILFSSAMLCLVVADFHPFSEVYSAKQASPETIADLKAMGEFLAADPDWFRVLPAGSYTPLMAMASAYSGKPAAWSWLWWSSPRRTADLLLDSCYPLLETGDPAKVARSARLAGLSGVKYYVDDRQEPPDLSLGASGSLKRAWGQGRFLVAQNEHFTPYVRAYPRGALGERLPESGDEPSIEELLARRPIPIATTWRRPRADEIVVRIEDDATTRSLRLVVAESWAPNWRVSVDGAPGKVERADHAFLGVDLTPGQREIRFVYTRPLYSVLGYWISAVSAGLIGYYLIRNKRRRPMGMPRQH